MVLEALGQAFFSLSIGMGALITYGSYISKEDNLSSSALIVSFADTFIAILAGVAIFPAVFAFGINPAEGPELVFITLPNIFLRMPGGYFFAIIFFLLLSIAALTSSISILEVVVAYLVEELKMHRKGATWVAAIASMCIGVLSTASFGLLPVRMGGVPFFDILNYASAKVLLPVGGLFIVLFIGWVMKREVVESELSNQHKIKLPLFKVFRILVRFVAPVAIALVFLYGIGLIA
ncbi:MAG: hypothetical protein CSA04_04580 [Bacteroidetes bacterium]|nr:MAG: hypothetical protein CSA04_04580 [Bacteroidota bacterium]